MELRLSCTKPSIYQLNALVGNIFLDQDMHHKFTLVPFEKTRSMIGDYAIFKMMYKVDEF